MMLHSNCYSFTAVHAPLALAKNLLVLTPPAGKRYRVLEAEWTIDGNDVNQQLRAAIYRVTVAGTGAKATTIVGQPLVVGGPAATVVGGHSYATTEPTLHTAPLWSLGFPSLSGGLYLPKREKEIIRVINGSELSFRIDTASFTSSNVILRVRIEEEP